MKTTSIAMCPQCGQKLGIPGDSGTVHVTCPRCAAQWDWPPRDSSRRTADSTEGTPPPGYSEPYANQHDASLGRASLLRDRRWVVGLGLLVIVTFIGYRKLTYTPAKPLPGAEAIVAEARRPVWSLPPEQPLPDNGHGVFSFDQSTADSRLRIVPRGEQGHVVLKVEGADDARLVCWIFIRQAELAEIAIPSGTYRLKLACGKSWYGEVHLFGPGASYSAISDTISIPTRTDATINLHPDTAGTLRETALSPEDF